MTVRNYRIRCAGNNFAEGSGVTLTASSEMSGFPASNMLHQRRSKIARTNGHFEVTASNKVIYYNDGSDGSVSLTEGDYTSPDALATEVQTQLNASSSNWTCTYSSSTFKFTIDRSAGTKTLRKSQTTNAAWDLLGYTGSLDEDAGEADESRNHTAETYTLDFGAAQTVLLFAMIAKKGEDFTVSTSQSTVTLMANSSDSWSSPALSVTCTVTTDGIMTFLDDQADTTYRYWRVKIVDRTNTVGPQGFKFGHLYLGDYETFTTTNVAGGFGVRNVDPSIIRESEGGGLFADTRTKYRVWDGFNVDQITASERRDWEAFINRVGITTPFYASWDPLETWTASPFESGGYVRFDADPQFTHVIRDYFMLDFGLREAV